MAINIWHSGVIKAGSTSRFIEIILNSGQAAHTSYTCKYTREGDAAATTVTLDAGTAGAYGAAGQMIKIDQDIFQFSLPDASIAAGAKRVIFKIHDTVTPNLFYFIFDLVTYDPQDSVRMGMTALPNAAADAAGGLPISDAGALDLDTRLGYLTAAVATASALTAAKAVVDAIKAVTDALPDAGALTTIDSIVDAIKAVTDNLPEGGALTTLLANVAAILADTGTTLPAQIGGLTDPSSTLATILERVQRLPDVPASRADVTSIAAGAGADAVTLTVQIAGVPVADANVWITSDESGNDLVAGTKTTNSNGEVTFLLEDGETYFMWAQKDGVLDAQAVAFVAEAD